MHDDNIMLTYKGEITGQLVSAMMETVEPRLKCMEQNLRIRKKLYNVMLECMQNIVHHQDIDKLVSCDDHITLVLLTSEETSYFIRTGNMISNERIHELKGWLDVVNSLSPEDLRMSYKKILDKGEFSVKGTAGLGFIDIARKSGQKLKYAFEKLNDHYSIFSFFITIPKSYELS